MKKTLIDFEVFKKIKNESLSSAEKELVEAQDILARTLGLDGLRLHCFGESDVTYETPDRSFIHANYKLGGRHIILDNIQELVIDEESSKKESHSVLQNMVDEILNSNDAQATNLFSKYLSIPSVRRGLMEGKDFFDEMKEKKKSPAGIAKKIANKLSGKEGKFKDKDKDDENISVRFKTKHEVKAPKKKLKEWINLAENVVNYVDYQKFGPNLRDAEVRYDERGNVTAARIPNATARNEGKILTLSYKHMLDTELKVCRGKMKTVHESSSFCHAMSDLRKAHAISDDASMQQIVEAIVTKWPEILYLTHVELSQRIGAALDTVGEQYHDDMCDYLAEGILRTAVTNLTDRTNKIVKLAGKQLDKENVYESFMAIVEKFYASIDEAMHIEMQVFVDLYNTLVEVHSFARKEGNEMLRSETNEFLKELYSVINHDQEPTNELAGEVASWLASLVEANVAGAEETWNVSNTPHQTISGDHPRMSWCANQGDAVPSKHPGDWGGKLPVSDGKSYKNGLEDEMRNNAWGNWSSDETWPNIKNPNVLKPFGDYKMKEKSAVNDGENDWSRWQSDKTYPNLKNPNVEESPWRPEKYKMKSDNLVSKPD